MIENQKLLDSARKSLDKFMTEPNADWLFKAEDALENVVLKKEKTPVERKAIQSQALDTWLRFLDLVIRNIDPAFNPDDVPEKSVVPPELPDPKMGSLRPGADPALIPDAKLRAEYERAIANHRKKVRHYGLQIDLQRMEGVIRRSVRNFIASAYTPTKLNQLEVRKLIEHRISDRKELQNLMQLPFFLPAVEQNK